MKIKVKYYIPLISVIGEVEVGDVINNEIDKKQAKIIDDFIVSNLIKKLKRKVEATSVKTSLKI